MVKFGGEFLQRLKDATNIVDVVGSYVTLKKRGSTYWASCPFHGPERTPSFHVDPGKGFYYCFGCHASGDVISFIQKMDKCTFPEAVKKLADAAHMEMPQDDLSPEEKKRQAERKQMYDVMAMAGRYFHNCLTKTPLGEPGIAYFEGKRHLSPETIEKFQLGFAPPGWETLFTDFTVRKKTPPQLLTEVGLCKRNERGGYFDIFRNRCMFPIWNLKGSIVAFGGRVMDDSKPKYLNSPDTPIFNKRRLLFGLYQALPEIRKKRQAIMVEGYMDCISLHAHGVTNAVASLGTAFTEEQARLLKRYADEVVFSYDMDAAGQNATKRALEIAAKTGLKLRVALVGEGKDPDEFVNLHGGEAYLEAVKQARPALDYLFSALCQQYDPTLPEGQHKILEEMFTILMAQDDTFQFDAFIKKMASAFRMDEGLIRAEASKFMSRQSRRKVYVAPHKLPEVSSSPEPVDQKRQRLLEAGFLKYCLHYHALPDGWEMLQQYQFVDAFHQRLFTILEILPPGEITEKNVEALLPREDIPKLAGLSMDGDEPGTVPMEEYIRPLKKLYLQNEYNIHTRKAQELMNPDPEKAREEQMICLKLGREIAALSG